jgi:hypothetical protein
MNNTHSAEPSEYLRLVNLSQGFFVTIGGKLRYTADNRASYTLLALMLIEK